MMNPAPPLPWDTRLESGFQNGKFPQGRKPKPYLGHGIRKAESSPQVLPPKEQYERFDSSTQYPSKLGLKQTSLYFIFLSLDLSDSLLNKPSKEANDTIDKELPTISRSQRRALQRRFQR